MSNPPSPRESDPPRDLAVSTSGRASPMAEASQAGALRPPNIELSQSWIPTPATQAHVSMFTGGRDAPPSPSPSAKPDGQDATLSPGSIDRVFPVRSAISIDPVATPLSRGDAGSGFPNMRLSSGRRTSDTTWASTESTQAIPESPTKPLQEDPGPRSDAAISGNRQKYIAVNVDGHLLSKIFGDDASQKSDFSGTSGGYSLPPQEPGLMTARFQHLATEGGHMVITGRDGETLQRCEDEPIHIPGAIQSFGLLVALREDEERLVVRVASENSFQIIGYTPQQLFKLDSFLDIFSEEQADNLLDHLDFIRDGHAADVAANGPDVFMISIRPPGGRTRKLWCAMHMPESDPGSIICEFEIEDDQINPLVPSNETTPDVPEDTLGSSPTAEELIDSTVNISKPLRILRSARKKRTEAAAMEVFNIMSQVQEQLANAPTLAIFLKVVIGIVKELTGFHRVMVYQFDQAWNGRVVAELVDPRATRDLYKGLHFPASDIPRQARDLYKINKVRLLYDRDQETARLVCRTLADLEKPLDMTHANLRAMSPIHLKYLANMGVRSSMSISINAFNELWGLVSCHTYGPKGMRVSFPIRKMCRLVGDTASRNIERLSYASRLQARKLINTTSSSTNPSGYIVASSDDLLKLFDADVGALSIRDETKILGKPRGNLQEVLAMVEYLRIKKATSVFCSHSIADDFPDLRYAPGWKFLAGVLFVPLSTGGNDFIAFFRRGALQEVKWAGNPYEKYVKEGTEGYLEPRKSFKAWSETIVGRCRDWTDEEIETASVLCLVYGKFIDVWRQKEAALQNSQLTRLLLANSAHEVRTPLNAVINYLEIALEGQLDQDTRDNLSKSHSASKSLVYVINDLLDLTKMEGGQSLVKEESFDFLHALQEATEPFAGDAKRKNLNYDVRMAAGLPQYVIGDHRRVRQVVSNLIANAIQHTNQGHVSVEASVLSEPLFEGKTEVEIVVEDSGVGMSQAKVDALFRELEEVTYEEDSQESKLLTADPFVDQAGKDQETLGLGLAVVARTIRNMNGQLRVKTEEGKGSRFVIFLAFDTDLKDSRVSEQPPPRLNSISRPTTAPSPDPKDGEVTLVYRAPGSRSEPAPMTRKDSAESMNSLTSLKSGLSVKSELSQKSDADRLIDAIQEPLKLAAEKVNARESHNRKRSSISAGGSQLMSPGSRHSKELKSALHMSPGKREIKDSGTPLRPVRVPDEFHEITPGSKVGPTVLFEEPDSVGAPSVSADGDAPHTSDNLSILVAEDDPINSKIMQKRLQKQGHSVRMTVNGEECSSAYGEEPAAFDAVLMDLQMPIVDGFSSTKLIRSYEKTHSQSCLSSRAGLNGRIPIFAVSASLVEKERDKYIQSGFDGWILKPVDFKRVDELLRGIVDAESRAACLYESGKWESGGWFKAREKGLDAFQIDTRPSPESLTAETERARQDDTSPAGSDDSVSTPSEATVVPNAQAN